MDGKVVRRRLPTLLVTAGMFVILTSTAAAQEARHGAPPMSAKLELGGNRVEIPFTLDPRLILVDAFVNDQGPYRFVLDTAAGMTVLDKKLAEKLGLKSMGNAHVGDATASGAKTAPIFELAGVRLGTAKWTGGVAVGLDLDELFDGELDHPVGILGVRLFADCLLTVDYAKKRIVLETGGLPEPDGKSVLVCEFPQGLPMIKTELAGKPLDLTLDTGAGLSMALAESLKDSIPIKGELKPVGISKRVNTEETTREARAAGDLALGAARVPAPRLTFSGVRSVVGFEVLKNFAITIDRQNGRIRLASAEKAVEVGPRCVTGFGTHVVDGVRKVRWVLPGLPAEKAGIQIGDELTAVDGKSSKSWKHVELVERFEKPGKLALELKRGEQTLHVDLEILVAVP